jgi:hypothetical protein
MIENPQLLAAFYNEVTQEIRRLRQDWWRFSYYFIAEATGVILLAGDGKLDRFINLSVHNFSISHPIGLHHILPVSHVSKPSVHY